MEMKIIEIEKHNKIKVQYVGGDCLGFGEFKLTPSGKHTEVVFYWEGALYSKRIQLVGKILPVGRLHWLIVNLVLRNLERHIARS